ncbi:MAG: DUF4097 family beta strand repeat protein [Xanthomonadales bacterium]|nr:DUF4097 family beta strand repeat protein [Xanthomonadales bacterium]
MSAGNLKLVVALLALAPLTVFADKSVDERWDINADATISIENIAGEIVIEGWDKKEARLTGELGDSVDELEISATSSRLQIEVLNRNQRNIDDTDLKLMIPYGASIDASAVSANIDISGMNNERITASSVSGDVDVDASSQRVSVESVSGNVSFEGETDRISAESVSGDIDMSGISGQIDANTVSGELEMQAGMIESAKLETVSGNLKVTGEVADNGKLTAESMSGDVSIYLPSSQSGLFKAQTFSGDISSDFGSVRNVDHGPGSHLKHVSGDSGAEVRVGSFSGNIKLKHD